MMTSELIKKHKELSAKVDRYFLEHQEAVMGYEALKSELEYVTDEIKEVVRQNQQSIETDKTVFSYSLAFHKWIDYPTAVLHIPREKLRDFLKLVKTEPVVDFNAFKKACEAGEFPLEALVESYREEALTPRVSVKQKD